VSDIGPALVWFRQDLRLADNPALAGAVASGRPVALAYILDDETPGAWAMGGASRWWLHHSLTALAADASRLGAQLILRRGRWGEALPRLAAELGASAVHWSSMVEPFARAGDEALITAFAGRACRYPDSGSLFPPADQERPAAIFTPYWRGRRPHAPGRTPLPAPKSLNAAPRVASERLESWRLTPRRPNWAAHFPLHWAPGEAAARAALARFADNVLDDYAEGRNQLGEARTSHLSAHLHFGEFTPAQIWNALAAQASAERFFDQLGWREFSRHLLFHRPTLTHMPQRAAFADFPWRQDQAAFDAWKRGVTGVPIVDAGMRELWATGAMHNRARMIVASFLTKHLMIHWREGAAWFWDTLVDADLANNSASWQWAAGCGVDAAPYFRIFNPVLQGQRFDADGVYVRRWVPELAKLPDGLIHQPWRASARDLAGAHYPAPIVDLAAARTRALAAFQSIKR